MILGLILKKDKYSLSYMGLVHDRMNKNLFMKGKVIEPLESFYVFNSNPLIPSLHLFGFAMLFAMLYLNNFVFRWYVVIPLIFIVSAFFSSFVWHKFVITMGLRKHGYKGSLKFLKVEDVLRKVIDID